MANPRYNTQTTNRRGAMGGGMMKRAGYTKGTNPGDLNKDGKMSGYETARSNAIKKAMSKKNKGKA